MNTFLSKFPFRATKPKSAPASRKISSWVDEEDARIVYVLRPRARRISIKIDISNRRANVTVPGSARKLEAARRFVREKYDWILVQFEALPAAQPFVDGGRILFRGALCTLHNPGGRGRPGFDPATNRLIIPAPEGALAGRTKRFLIRQAREALTHCTTVHAAALGKHVDKISVRDTSSRWGSCVSRPSGNHISYSWRLICAPPFVLDYVCAHECAHLVHPDHSKAFWDQCNALVDTVAPAKAWLKKNGHKLHAVGAQA